ncbi:MAG: RnfABCDGE type electron transport complex subunit D [Desulfuromonadaceae bacterium]|nr:RnfABCDGE type electron transport complex subunit D [Desulfuromonadaceae bacterium]
MNKSDKILLVTSSPHIHSPYNVPDAMRDVILSLIPALICGLYFFGLPALKVVLGCVVTAYITELICLRASGKEVKIREQSAVVTGLLLALCLPPSLPLWMAATGSAFAIVIVKHLFGGLGQNIFNPALIGRAFLLASFPVSMTRWSSPLDGVTTATPLSILKEASGQPLPELSQLFIGNVAGSIGETSVIALLLGGIFLLYRGHIDWRTPLSLLATVFILTTVAGIVRGAGIEYPLFHLFSGALFLGAFFMATDWVTTPVTKLGRILFGIGSGCLIVMIRLKGGYPEGVAYAILLMNVVTPLIDRYTKARVFGGVKRNA